MANFFCNFFGLVFPGYQPPPPPPKKKMQAQNSRPELSAFLSKFTFSSPKFCHVDFLLAGETENCLGIIFGHRNFSKGKQPKDKVFGQDIPGNSGTQTSGYPDKNFMQVTFLCCFRQGVAGIWVGTSRISKNFMEETLG